MESANLTRFAWLSIGAAILTIALKTTAYWLTDSVGCRRPINWSISSPQRGARDAAIAARLRMRCMPSVWQAEYFSSGLEASYAGGRRHRLTAVPRPSRATAEHVKSVWDLVLAALSILPSLEF
jgi:hypothetical protein